VSGRKRGSVSRSLAVYLGVLERLEDGEDGREVLERLIGEHADVLGAHVDEVEPHLARGADAEADVGPRHLERVVSVGRLAQPA
jgi:hypothetical protein